MPVIGDGFLGLCPLGQSSSIDRCVLISGLALLPALSGMPLTAIAQTQTTQDSALGSWNDGPAKQAIIDFVATITGADGIRAMALNTPLTLVRVAGDSCEAVRTPAPDLFE